MTPRKKFWKPNLDWDLIARRMDRRRGVERLEGICTGLSECQEMEMLFMAWMISGAVFVRISWRHRSSCDFCRTFLIVSCEHCRTWVQDSSVEWQSGQEEF